MCGLFALLRGDLIRVSDFFREVTDRPTTLPRTNPPLKPVSPDDSVSHHLDQVKARPLRIDTTERAFAVLRQGPDRPPPSNQPDHVLFSSLNYTHCP